MKLTESQKEAIHSDAPNILVNASAGSGKTSVFAARIVNLIKSGVEPSRILALTFSKDAAENMTDRVAQIIGEEAKLINMSTFHSFAYKRLFSIFSDYYNKMQMMKGWWKMQQLFSIVSKPNNMNPAGLSLSIKAPELAMFISYQKANMVIKGMPVIINDFTDYAFEDSREDLQAAYEMFLERQKNARLIEYDDLLLHFFYRLKQDKKLRESIANSFDYVMVDEFQDTSRINLEILKMITHNNLFVVGDFRQSIYGFINADIKNILNFHKEFDDVKVIELQENFRSTENIVKLSNSIIENRDVPEYKQFKNAKSAIDMVGDKPNFTIYKQQIDEIQGIIGKIESEIDENSKNYSDFAILLRTNAQMGIYESAFTESEIPLDVSHSHSFFDRTEIDVLLSYLRAIVNLNDNQSVARIINKPNRYISNKLLADLDKFAFINKISIFQALKTFKPIAQKKQIQYLIDLLYKYQDNIEDISAKRLLQDIINKTRFKEYISKTARNANDFDVKTQAIDSLLSMSNNFSNVPLMLTHIDIIKEKNKKPLPNSVKMMTVHAAKGQEFNHVFLPELTDDFFPHEMCNGDIEGEARLLYVAISRAKFNIDLSYSASMGDKGGVIKPSRFFDKIYPDLLLKQKQLYKGTDLVRI